MAPCLPSARLVLGLAQGAIRDLVGYRKEKREEQQNKHASLKATSNNSVLRIICVLGSTLHLSTSALSSSPRLDGGLVLALRLQCQGSAQDKRM